MATQRLTVATLGGTAGRAVGELFRAWRSSRADGGLPTCSAVDEFAARLRSHGADLSVLYFCEWIDRWLAGDLVPGPAAVAGRQFEASCLSPEEATAWAGRSGDQFPEQLCLAARVREAAAASQPWEGPAAVVVLREVLGATTTDEEVLAALQTVPDWLSRFRVGERR